MTFELFCFYLEMVGTIAFSVSGTIIGIKKKMDVFGNLALAIITAVGGGIFRDILLGIAPPLILQKPFAFMVAVITSIVIMIFVANRHKITLAKFMHVYAKIMFISDSIGLGIFTILGMNVAIRVGYGDNILILLLGGMLTGVGGGMIRDVLAREIPMIFTQNIYAVSSLIGGSIYIIARSYLDNYSVCVIIAMSAIIAIRIVSEKYKINLSIL